MPPKLRSSREGEGEWGRRGTPGGFVLALTEDGEREGEEKDQEHNQDSECYPFAHPVSSLDYPSLAF